MIYRIIFTTAVIFTACGFSFSQKTFKTIDNSEKAKIEYNNKTFSAEAKQVIFIKYNFEITESLSSKTVDFITESFNQFDIYHFEYEPESKTICFYTIAANFESIKIMLYSRDVKIIDYTTTNVIEL